jgi:hypothetical protein
MWLVFTLITILTGIFTHTESKAASYATVAFIYLYSGVHNLGWTGASMLYVVEILPYSMRAKGISLFWFITGLAGAFNTYVNPLGFKAFGWKFYFFYVVVDTNFFDPLLLTYLSFASVFESAKLIDIN